MIQILRRIPPAPCLFLGFLFFFLLSGRSQMFRDPGTFWHTRVGETILQNGFFSTDVFSFSHAGAYWIPHQWLGEVSMAVIHGLAGWDGLLLFTACLLSVMLTGLTMRMLNTGLHPVLSLLVAAVGLAVVTTHIHVRPHVVTIMLMALLYAILMDVESGRKPFRFLWALVPICLLWTNIHGGVLGGFMVLGMAGVGWQLWRWLGWSTPLVTLRDTLRFAVISLCCVAMVLVTPYGGRIAGAWLKIMAMSDLAVYVEEHAPLDWRAVQNWPLLLLGLIYLTLLVTLRQAPRVMWLIPLFWLLQAQFRVRHGPLFAVTAMIAMADMWPCSRIALRWQATRPDLYCPKPDPGRTPRWAWLAVVAIVSVIACIQIVGWQVPVVGRGWVQFDRSRWPVEMVEDLRSVQASADRPLHLFNENEYGGFLIFHLPGSRVFFDDRFELYGVEFTKEFVESKRDDPRGAIDRWQASYGSFDAALLHADSSFATYFDEHPEQWQQVRRTPASVLYIRKSTLALRE